MSTRYIPFSIYKKENRPKLSQICSYGIFSKGLKNEFEAAVVNEPSVFEPLKFYCIYSIATFEILRAVFRSILTVITAFHFVNSLIFVDGIGESGGRGLAQCSSRCCTQ